MDYYVSEERLAELKAELEELKGEGRRRVADRLRRAKEYGDLSENSEYTEAKEEQSNLERRIVELEDMVTKAVIIGEGTKRDGISVGSTVHVKSDKGEFVYRIVGSNEASPAEGKISNESPLGAAFLGHQAGDKVMVTTPGGEVVYTITKVQ
ncbi:MAG: transcription elongation factor GreA [Anaplasmataceae bacterium]|nr:transcription elongation factor GreA [Anaplasmataceae bacterium]